MPTFPQARAIDPLLTDYAQDLSQSMANAVQDVLFPVKRVRGETGTYYEFDANQRFRTYNDYRADGAEAASIGWKLDKSTYALEEYALKTDVTDRERENALDPISLDQEATALVSEALTMAREIRARDAVMETATGPAVLNFTASARWDQNTSTTVLIDNENIKQGFQKKTGKKPNVMIIPPVVWKYFVDPSIGSNTVGGVLHDKLKYTTAVMGNDITPNLVAQLFGVERVIVPDIVFTDTSLTNSVVKPGTGITSGAYVWDTYTNNSTVTKEIFYAYVNPNAGVKSLTYGWTFQSQPLTTFRYREDKLRKDWIELSRVEDAKVVARSALYTCRVLT